MFCNKCGQKIVDGAMFCNKCGNSIIITNVQNNNKELQDKSYEEKKVVNIVKKTEDNQGGLQLTQNKESEEDIQQKKNKEREKDLKAIKMDAIVMAVVCIISIIYNIAVYDDADNLNAIRFGLLALSGVCGGYYSLNVVAIGMVTVLSLLMFFICGFSVATIVLIVFSIGMIIRILKYYKT